MATKQPPAKVLKIITSDTESDEEISRSIDFTEPWHFSDVVLVVEDRKFHVHKSTLSMNSPVFEKMFTSGFRERKAKEIPLPGKNPDEIEVLLNLMYQVNTNHEVDCDNYKFLLKLADEYQIEKIKSLCSSYMTNFLDHDNCLEFCKTADLYGLTQLLEDCTYSSKQLNLPSIQGSLHYKDISDKVKLQILSSRMETLESLLNQYSSTCKSLVTSSFVAVAKKLHESECCNNKRHSVDQNSPIAQKKKFDPGCHCCTRKLENKWPEKDALSKCIRTPLKKLRTLNASYDVNNIFVTPESPVIAVADSE